MSGQKIKSIGAERTGIRFPRYGMRGAHSFMCVPFAGMTWSFGRMCRKMRLKTMLENETEISRGKALAFLGVTFGFAVLATGCIGLLVLMLVL